MTGVFDVLAVEERLANLVADLISPKLVPDIEIMPYRNKQILVARVYPSAVRPHYLVRLGPEAGVFVRVGSTNRRADAAQIGRAAPVFGPRFFRRATHPGTQLGSA